MTAPGLRPICDHGRCQQILAAFAQAKNAWVASEGAAAARWLSAAIDRAGLDDETKGRLVTALCEVLTEAAGDERVAA